MGRAHRRCPSVLERGKRQRPYRDTVHLLAEALGLTGAEQAPLGAAVPRRTDGNTATDPRATRLPVTAHYSSGVSGRRRWRCSCWGARACLC